MQPLDISGWVSVEARVEFTPAMDPAMIGEGDGLAMVSLLDEIEANQSTPHGQALREGYGFIPYSSPLYWWESVDAKLTDVRYIGQTVRQRIQERFKGHGNVVRLLARHVNDDAVTVLFRMCSRLDVRKDNHDAWKPLEWLVSNQAEEVVTEIESMLIYLFQPELNVQYKDSPRKRPWKTTTLVELLLP